MILTNDGCQVRTLTLNRPEAMNAFSGELFDALTDALIAATDASSVRVIILTAAGRAFCAGLDLREVGKGLPRLKHGVPGFFRALIDCP